MDIKEILQYLPHRYPFLLVDRMLEIEPGVRARGLKNVTMNEPFFPGHFPHHPVMPGVLIIEAMAQTAGVICIRSVGSIPSLVYFMTIDSAKFRQPVVPGDRLELHVRKTRQRGSIYKYECTAEVGGVKVAEAEISAMMVPQDQAL